MTMKPANTLVAFRSCTLAARIPPDSDVPGALPLKIVEEVLGHVLGDVGLPDHG